MAALTGSGDALPPGASFGSVRFGFGKERLRRGSCILQDGSSCFVQAATRLSTSGCSDGKELQQFRGIEDFILSSSVPDGAVLAAGGEKEFPCGKSGRANDCGTWPYAARRVWCSPPTAKRWSRREDGKIRFWTSLKELSAFSLQVRPPREPPSVHAGGRY